MFREILFRINFDRYLAFVMKDFSQYIKIMRLYLAVIYILYLINEGCEIMRTIIITQQIYHVIFQ